MLKRNAPIVFWGLLWYAIIIFLKDYYLNLFYFMISDSKDSDGNVISLIIQSAILVIGAILFAWFRKIKERKDSMIAKDLWTTIGFNTIGNTNCLMSILIGIISFFSFNLLKSCVTLLMAFLGSDITIGYIDAPVDPTFFVFVVLMLGVWMPIGEEMLYRGVLFYMISSDKHAVTLILFNCIVFAGAHQSAEQMIQAFFLGGVLCILVRKMNSITMGLLVHVSYNVVGLVMTYFFPLFFFNVFGADEEMSYNQMLLSAAIMLFFSILTITLLMLLISRLEKPIDQTIEKQENQADKKNYLIPAVCMIIVVSSYSMWKIVRAFGHLCSR